MLLEIKDGVRTNPTGRGKVPRVMVLQCDVCRTQYERPYSKHHFDEPVHRCSQKCMYGSRSTDGLGGHGADVIEMTCATCGKPIQGRRIGNERKWGKMCSRKCYGAYRSQHPELYATNIAAMHAPEVCKRATETRERRYALGELVHPRLGKHHSEETKRAISRHHIETKCLNGEKNGMFGRHHRVDSREKMSNTRSQQILDGTAKIYPGNSKHGSYVTKKGLRLAFKSGWEEATMQWLDANIDVVQWDYEKVRIPYTYNNHKRWYVPDFLVSFVDGHQEMWEVKPKFHRNAEQVRLKAEAAQIWCLQNNITSYQLLTGDVLRDRGILL